MNIKCSTHVLEFDDWCWWRRISFQCSRTKWFRVWYCLSNFGRWVMWQLLLAKEVLVSSALQFDIELKKLKSKISADRYFKSTKLNSGNQKPYRYNCQRCFFFHYFWLLFDIGRFLAKANTPKENINPDQSVIKG